MMAVTSIEYGGQTRFYHTDQLGSTRVVTDATGEALEAIQYYPFGSYLTSDPETSYTFTGQEYDDELGFYNYKARLYDPVIARFITPDSIVPCPDDPQSWNRYTYARNNPLYYTDPTGHEEGGPDIGEGTSTDFAPSTITGDDGYVGLVARNPEEDPGKGNSTGWESGHAFDLETEFWGERLAFVLIVRPTDEKKARNPELSAVARHQISAIAYNRRASEARFIGIIPLPRQRDETTLYVYMIYEGSMTVLLGLHIYSLVLLPVWAFGTLPFPGNVAIFALLAPIIPSVLFCGAKTIEAGVTKVQKGLEGLGLRK